MVIIELTFLLRRFPRHARFPIGPHVLDLLLVVEIGVVVFADAAPALPQRQMLGVHRHAMVVLLAAGADERPADLLLLEVEPGGVGQKDKSNQGAGQAEPGNDVEFLLVGDVIIHDRGGEGTEFAAGGGEAVGGGADGGRVDFGGDEEGDGVGAKLVEEGGEEVHGLEGFDVGGRGVVFVVEGGDDEEDEVHQKSNHLHVLTAVEFVVDEEGCDGVSISHKARMTWACSQAR